MTRTNENQTCRCQTTDCGCAGTAESCRCDAPCRCKESCDCGKGCGCASKK